MKEPEQRKITKSSTLKSALCSSHAGNFRDAGLSATCRDTDRSE
jgi:hypothetical protein